MKTVSRRRAREVALQVLYCLDANPELDATAALTLYFDRFADSEDGGGTVFEGDPDERSPGQSAEQLAEQSGGAQAGVQSGVRDRIDRPFLESLVRGVTEGRAGLDERLSQLSRNWRVERIARVERTILRMALYELEQRPDIPARVVLNEAIELAKGYGAADAPAFVNGLLDSALHGQNRK